MFLPENSDPELRCGREWASLENSFSSALLPGERVVGNLVATKANLSLPWPWRWQTMGMYSSQVESRLLHPSICPSNLKPPKEACLLCLGPHDEVPSFWLTCSFIKAKYPPMQSPFSSFSPPKGTDPDGLLFLYSYLIGYLSLIVYIVQ